MNSPAHAVARTANTRMIFIGKSGFSVDTPISSNAITGGDRSGIERTPNNVLFPTNPPVPPSQENEHHDEIPCQKVPHGANGSAAYPRLVREWNPNDCPVAGSTVFPGKDGYSWEVAA